MSDTITFTQAYNIALDEAMAADSNVIMLGEDIGDKEGGGAFKVTGGLSSKYGTDRVRTTPISEQAIMGAAIGASLVGKKPVAEIMLMNFVTVAMDMMVNHAAKLRFMSGGQTSVPITIRTRTGAGMGAGGQHSDMLEAWFCHTAGMKVVVPSTPADAVGLLRACIEDPDPCLFIEDALTRAAKGPKPPANHILPLGKAHVEQEGSDVTFISYGRPMQDIRKLAPKLADEGISLEIIDLRTVSPLDTDTLIKSVNKTGRAVIAHEAVRSFGSGAEIAARIQEACFGALKAPIKRVASKDVAVPFSRNLEQEFLYKASDIETAIRETLEGK